MLLKVCIIFLTRYVSNQSINLDSKCYLSSTNFKHTAAVPMIKFANNDRTLLCCSSVDASLSICDVSLQPPKVVTMLKGHQQTVTSK